MRRWKLRRRVEKCTYVSNRFSRDKGNINIKSRHHIGKSRLICRITNRMIYSSVYPSINIERCIHDFIGGGMTYCIPAISIFDVSFYRLFISFFFFLFFFLWFCSIERKFDKNFVQIERCSSRWNRILSRDWTHTFIYD